MENGDQGGTALYEIITSEHNEQKDHIYEQQIINGHTETQDSKTSGEPEKSISEQTGSEALNKNTSEQLNGEPEKSTSEPEKTISNDTEEPAVRPKEPKQSMNDEKNWKGETQEEEEEEEEDPNTAVLKGNLRDYNEYQHDSPEEIRKKQLADLAPEHTANIRGVHHHHQYSKVQPESFLWLSIFTLIFFSRIFGAIALYKSIKVRLLFSAHKYTESEAASKEAKKWNIVGMIFCLCWVTFVLVILKGIGLFDKSVDEV